MDLLGLVFFWQYCAKPNIVNSELWTACSLLKLVRFFLKNSHNISKVLSLSWFVTSKKQLHFYTIVINISKKIYFCFWYLIKKNVEFVATAFSKNLKLRMVNSVFSSFLVNSKFWHFCTFALIFVIEIMAAAITSKGRDFYAILGVEKTAGQGQIKQAYR